MPGTRACVRRPLPTRERPAPTGYAAAAAPRDHAPVPHMASGRGPESVRRAVGLAQTMRMERDASSLQRRTRPGLEPRCCST